MKIDNQKIKKEALALAEETLADIELSRLPIANIALKASRLSRLVNEFELEKIFEYEVSGYPYTAQGIAPDVWELGERANRITVDEKNKTMMNYYSIATIENRINSTKIALSQTQDRNISITSANPAQIINPPPNNSQERRIRLIEIRDDSNFLAQRTTFIYSSVKKIYMDLKFSSLTESIWLKLKSRIDSYIREIIPEETQKLTAIYDSLNDDNPEKWSTALTSCRRMLKALADKLYPSTKRVIKKGKKEIKVDEEHYINRLICYIEETSTHETLDKITNSNLKYIGDRLDNVIEEACKGTHVKVDKEEAERCFMHVYMLIGDILEIERQKNKE